MLLIQQTSHLEQLTLSPTLYGRLSMYSFTSEQISLLASSIMLSCLATFTFNSSFVISFKLCQKALNIKSFCLYELLSHTHFPYDSNNHIGNIFYHRKDNDSLFVLLHSYLHFVINSKTEEIMLELMNIKATINIFVLKKDLKIFVFQHIMHIFKHFNKSNYFRKIKN